MEVLKGSDDSQSSHHKCCGKNLVEVWTKASCDVRLEKSVTTLATKMVRKSRLNGIKFPNISRSAAMQESLYADDFNYIVSSYPCVIFFIPFLWRDEPECTTWVTRDCLFISFIYLVVGS